MKNRGQFNLLHVIAKTARNLEVNNHNQRNTSENVETAFSHNMRPRIYRTLPSRITNKHNQFKSRTHFSLRELALRNLHSSNIGTKFLAELTLLMIPKRSVYIVLSAF